MYGNTVLVSRSSGCVLHFLDEVAGELASVVRIDSDTLKCSHVPLWSEQTGNVDHVTGGVFTQQLTADLTGCILPGMTLPLTERRVSISKSFRASERLLGR